MGWVLRRIDNIRDGYAATSAVWCVSRSSARCSSWRSAGGICFFSLHTPTGFLPEEDQVPSSSPCNCLTAPRSTRTGERSSGSRLC